MPYLCSPNAFFLVCATIIVGHTDQATALEQPRNPDEQLLKEVSAHASKFSNWLYSTPGALGEVEALREREEGILKLKQIFEESEPGSAEWAKLKFRRIGFALDDKEVVELADVPDKYLETIPVEVAHLRKIQVDAYLRMGNIQKASQIAEKCVSWTSNSGLLEAVKAGGFDRGAFLRHIQDIGVNVVVTVPQFKGTVKQKIEMVDRVASANNSPQILAAKTMAKNTVSHSKAYFETESTLANTTTATKRRWSIILNLILLSGLAVI